MDDSSAVETFSAPRAFDAELPQLVQLYLASHGYDRAVVNIVELAADFNVDKDSFISHMALKGMPMAEAAFLWTLMQSQT